MITTIIIYSILSYALLGYVFTQDDSKDFHLNVFFWSISPVLLPILLIIVAVYYIRDLIEIRKVKKRLEYTKIWKGVK